MPSAWLPWPGKSSAIEDGIKVIAPHRTAVVSAFRHRPGCVSNTADRTERTNRPPVQVPTGRRPAPSPPPRWDGRLGDVARSRLNASRPSTHRKPVRPTSGGSGIERHTAIWQKPPLSEILCDFSCSVTRAARGTLNVAASSGTCPSRHGRRRRRRSPAVGPSPHISRVACTGLNQWADGRGPCTPGSCGSRTPPPSDPRPPACAARSPRSRRGGTPRAPCSSAPTPPRSLALGVGVQIVAGAQLRPRRCSRSRSSSSSRGSSASTSASDAAWAAAR